jgi:hypothetical protein
VLRVKVTMSIKSFIDKLHASNARSMPEITDVLIDIIDKNEARSFTEITDSLTNYLHGCTNSDSDDGLPPSKCCDSHPNDIEHLEPKTKENKAQSVTEIIDSLTNGVDEYTNSDSDDEPPPLECCDSQEENELIFNSHPDKLDQLKPKTKDVKFYVQSRRAYNLESEIAALELKKRELESELENQRELDERKCRIENEKYLNITKQRREDEVIAEIERKLSSPDALFGMSVMYLLTTGEHFEVLSDLIRNYTRKIDAYIPNQVANEIVQVAKAYKFGKLMGDVTDEFLTGCKLEPKDSDYSYPRLYDTSILDSFIVADQ